MLDVLDGYDPGGFYCEMQRCPDTAPLRQRLAGLPIAEFKRRSAAAEQALYDLGVTFTVYSDSDAIDRILPFDAIPRVISAAEWRHIESGVIQRVTALNLLLDDLYHRQKIVRDQVLPADLVLGNGNFRPAMQGVAVPHGAYVNICGTDIIRGDDGIFRVLEDNARTPSGVSYVIENRQTMLRAFPDLLNGIGLRAIDSYGLKLAAALRDIAPGQAREPQIVLLSPGTYNSAFFEHVFLAREMGVPLVEGRDLLVENDRVYMRTIDGKAPVDVIYRRINDEFLDPEAFRPDSMLGVPGLMRAYICRQCGACQCRRHRRCRRQGGLCLHAANHPLLSRRRRGPAERRDLSSAARRKGYATRSTISPASSSSRSARRAATASRSGRGRARPSSTTAAPSCSPTRPTTSASPASTCRSRRPSSMAGSSRATSICGRSRSPARTPGCCPAG